MTPAARATALLAAAVVGAVAFVVAAAFADHLASREPAPHPRHLRVERHRHRLAPRREWLMWMVNTAGRAARVTAEFVRRDDGARAAVSFAVLFLAFSVLIGASQ